MVVDHEPPGGRVPLRGPVMPLPLAVLLTSSLWPLIAQRSLGWDHFHFLFLQLIGGDHPMVGGRFLTPVQTTVFTNRCPFPDSQGQPCTWCGCWDMIT